LVTACVEGNRDGGGTLLLLNFNNGGHDGHVYDSSACVVTGQHRPP
jgi:hypothetical protein